MSFSETAKEICSKYETHDLNEAETRSKIIDEIAKKILDWPESSIHRETHTSVGFIDYELRKSDEKTFLVIEAKREGIYFSIPNGYLANETHKFVSMRDLLTDDNISKAAYQAQKYCNDIGCQYACITNGNQWIFFKTFDPGRKWKNIPALVITNNKYFYENFTDAYNTLSYTSITESGSLESIFGLKRKNSENIFYPSEKITAYNQPVDANSLSRQLRPIVNKYFGAFDPQDHEFIESCYVTNNSYDKYLADFRNIISDSLSPYFETYGVKDVSNQIDGGNFGARIKKSLHSNKNGEVITLFGGKGAGKSTFINKVLYHNPPPFIEKHAIICIIDFLKTVETKEAIEKKFYTTLIEKLDQDGLLSGDRLKLISLFKDEYKTAINQDLYGIPESSIEYNTTLNRLTSEWKNDKEKCVSALIKYWKGKHKGAIVILDNTDQFNYENQDFCFSLAQQISDTQKCLAIISMREERFYGSRIKGYLDAFQNSGFHISAPITEEVFLKRVQYVIKLINEKPSELFDDSSTNTHIESCLQLFRVFNNEFSSKATAHLSNFLTSISHGNIRQALEIFRDFAVSGYLNVNEIISAQNMWRLKIHQVLKPIMMPNRFFFDETKSSIINLYRPRSRENSSHFTALRILNKLCINPESPSYLSIGELKQYFIEKYNMQDDLERNLSAMLESGIIESNIRDDKYSPNIDQVKATSYGWHLFKHISKSFTYLELACADTGFFEQSCASEIANLSNKEYKQFVNFNRYDRVITRLKKAEAFIAYLKNQEQQEFYHYGLTNEPSFGQLLADSFSNEKMDVLRSAERLKAP